MFDSIRLSEDFKCRHCESTYVRYLALEHLMSDGGKHKTAFQFTCQKCLYSFSVCYEWRKPCQLREIVESLNRYLAGIEEAARLAKYGFKVFYPVGSWSPSERRYVLDYDVINKKIFGKYGYYSF